MSHPAFWKDLCERGIVHQTTADDLGAWLAGQLAAGATVPVYCGFDPTAESLHIGSLMPVLGMRRLKNAGFLPIAVVGGATGMIGDPSGKSQERTFLDDEQLARNLAGLRGQLERLLEGEAGKDFYIVNNADWFRELTFIEFLRKIGKHFTVNMMIAKESVRARLEDREHGISYTEFSYMLLQAYDYLHLFEQHGCRLQVGGSDQWGNITAGIDLIHHKHPGEAAHGCTFPLVTTSSGQKFGKSERGAIWIDERRTHPYFHYKYFFDTLDADVAQFLNWFTFLSRGELDHLAAEVVERPQLREAQRTLARETTAIVHGRDVALACEGLEHAMHADDTASFETHAGRLGLLDPSTFPSDVDSTLPVLVRSSTQLDGDGISVIDLAVDAGLFKTKSEVRREMKSGGLRVGGRIVSDFAATVTRDSLEGRRVLQIRKGKSNKRMIVFV